MTNSPVIGKILLRSSPKLKEVSAEPNLLDVRLMVTLCDDLLDRVLLFTLIMLAQPHQ